MKKKTKPKVNPGKIVLIDIDKLKPHQHAALFPDLTNEEYAKLKDDVAERGVQTPLHVTEDGKVLSGHHRLRVAIELGAKKVPAIVIRGLTPAGEMLFLVRDNLVRRHLSAGQRAAIWTSPELKEAHEAFEKEAKARQAEGGRRGGKKAGRGRPSDRDGAKLPQGIGVERGPRARDAEAAAVGVSPRLVQDAKKGWSGAPDRMQAIAAGESRESVSAVAAEVRLQAKEADRDAKAKSADSAPESEPADRLCVILAMPPDYDTRSAAEFLGIVRGQAPMGKGVAAAWRLLQVEHAGAILLQQMGEGPDEETSMTRRDSPFVRLFEGMGVDLGGEFVNIDALVGRTWVLDLEPGRRGPEIKRISPHSPEFDAEERARREKENAAAVAMATEPRPEDDGTAATGVLEPAGERDAGAQDLTDDQVPEKLDAPSGRTVLPGCGTRSIGKGRRRR